MSRSERDEEDRQARALQDQIERAAKHQRRDGDVEQDGEGGAVSHQLVRDRDEPLAFGLAGAPRVAADRPRLAPSQAVFAEPDSRWATLPPAQL